MFIVSGRHGVDRFRNFIGFFAENARLYKIKEISTKKKCEKINFQKNISSNL